MAKVIVLSKRDVNRYGGIEVDTTSRGPSPDLSPFYLGPIELHCTRGVVNVVRFENLWQYSKVYMAHAVCPFGEQGKNNPLNWFPTEEFFTWRNAGFAKTRAERYPMGKGGPKPLYSYWKGAHLTYIEARKAIYIPIYARLVERTRSFAWLKELYARGETIVLRDFDGYDFEPMGMTLKDVVNNPSRPMGHAFVIKMLLEGRLDECL